MMQRSGPGSRFRGGRCHCPAPRAPASRPGEISFAVAHWGHRGGDFILQLEAPHRSLVKSFGLERVGYIGIAAPYLALICMALVTASAAL